MHTIPPVVIERLLLGETGRERSTGGQHHDGRRTAHAAPRRPVNRDAKAATPDFRAKRVPSDRCPTARSVAAPDLAFLDDRALQARIDVVNEVAADDLFGSSHLLVRGAGR